MPIRRSILVTSVAASAFAALLGCGRDPGPLDPWPLPTDPIVFQDAFTGAVAFEAFGNSKLDALSTDVTEQFEGSGCIRVTVPNPGQGYAGGAFTTARARDLTGYNALTFYAKASKTVTLVVAGLGNDNRGTSKFEAGRRAVPVTTTWTKQVIPIPVPNRLTAERGLFYFSAEPQGGSGYVLWFDDIKFERLDTITNPQPVMASQFLNSFVGATVNVTGTKVTFDVKGSGSVTVEHMHGYFDYASSEPSVAEVGDGVIRIVGPGVATITATMDTTTVAGSVTLNAGPFTPGLAPTPTLPAGNVVSLFSNAYANATVDRWSADWDRADLADLSIFGNDMKLYTNLVYAGIEFTTQPIDASGMTHFHADVWAADGTAFKVKLVDFGSDGTFGGIDEARDTERELTFNASSAPAFTPGSWVGLEVPLSAFMDPASGLVSRTHLAQLVVSGDVGSVYMDNIYFHK
ncbi:MAG TPA: hypothetical protein VLT84_06120 [Acidobacteriota bacterium]|nr:hypothetical protein [Acidobacteriota bacterium]